MYNQAIKTIELTIIFICKTSILPIGSYNSIQKDKPSTGNFASQEIQCHRNYIRLWKLQIPLSDNSLFNILLWKQEAYSSHHQWCVALHSNKKSLSPINRVSPRIRTCISWSSISSKGNVGAWSFTFTLLIWLGWWQLWILYGSSRTCRQ